MYLGLPAPANVKVTALAHNRVEVTWDQSSGATGYAISYATTATDGDHKRVIMKRQGSMSHILTDLEDDTDYTITVQGTTNGGMCKGAESDQTTVKTHKFGK